MLLAHAEELNKYFADFYAYRTDYGSTEVLATHVFFSVDAIDQLITLARKNPSQYGAYVDLHMYTHGGVFMLDNTMFSDELADADKRCVSVENRGRTFSCDRIFTVDGAYACTRDLLKYIDWCIDNKTHESALAMIREFVSKITDVPEVKPVQRYIKL